MRLWGKKESHAFDFGLLKTDMHSHLLPGIDDGAPDLATSVEMINGLVHLGFKKLITTPHIMQDMYPNKRDDILKRYEALKQHLETEGIEVELGVAAEYFIDDNLKKLLADKEPLLTFGNNLVLVEFSMASEPYSFREILFEMQMQNYQPVIAHPERYIYQERNKEFFEELKLAGYLFQLNILSLAGAYGKTVTELARYFIKHEYYDIAGTDLHNVHHFDHLQSSSIAHGLKELLDGGKLLNPEL
ncbi:MAG TPA: CpsB/CapC family capsule biosynthesis tyrosine phosphatase [Chitinophagaceae bacterium]|nr:CpsB/CapC family capsule biosynthesis tyrosine phosphatase [Chitinophagaceae bacterium]